MVDFQTDLRQGKTHAELAGTETARATDHFLQFTVSILGEGNVTFSK
jgi:hypothetical protein